MAVEPRWMQLPMFPADAVEVRIRFGVVPSANHVQWLVELIDPATKELLGMESMPHGELARWSPELYRAGLVAAEMIRTILESADGVPGPGEGPEQPPA